jgi:hypothetical protein
LTFERFANPQINSEMRGRLSNLATLLQYSQLKRVPISDDGNSFYRAISQAYYKNQDFHLLLRKTLVEDILHSTAQYKPYFPTFPTSDNELLSSRQKGKWNPSQQRLLSFAVSQFLNVQLEIYSIQEDNSIHKQVFTGPTRSGTIRLLESKNHYDLLLKH